MINKTTTIFITLLVLTSCVFGQSMKLTKDVIKIIKERDEIKNTKTKAHIIYKCLYDSISGNYSPQKIASRKTYDKNGNMIEFLSYDANGNIDHATRFSYDGNNEILRTDSTKDGVLSDKKTYTNNLVSEEVTKSGATEKKSLFIYKFNKDGCLINKKMLDDKNKTVSEEIFTNDKVNKITLYVYNDYSSKVKIIRKYDANENEIEYNYFSPADHKKAYSKIISSYNEDGFIEEEKDFLYDSINVIRKYTYNEEYLLKVISYDANGNMGLWSSYKYNGLWFLIEEIDGYANQPREKLIYKYEYYE
jgi:hypothetical protein